MLNKILAIINNLLGNSTLYIFHVLNVDSDHKIIILKANKSLSKMKKKYAL